MQRNKFVTASAIGVLASLAGTGLALAQTAPPYRRGQMASNRSLRSAYGSVAEMIDELGLDQHDYAGHRVAAIGGLQAAKAQLLAGLQYRDQSERGQAGSDASMRYASGEVDRLVKRLQADTDDYGGHREQAITDLNNALQDLQQALETH
jgi:hypothetical protein